MKKSQKNVSESSDAIDSELVANIALNLSIEELPASISARIKQKIIDKINPDRYKFVFAEQGEWKPVTEGVQIKLLHRSEFMQSFLIKMEKNSSIPYHNHAENEESFVIDGEVWLDGVFCTQGDYHFAAAGSIHRDIHTSKGCTLLVRTARA